MGAELQEKAIGVDTVTSLCLKLCTISTRESTTPLILVPGLMVMKKPTRSLRTLNCQMMKVSSSEPALVGHCCFVAAG